MDADVDTLATALYVRTADLLEAAPEQAVWRPAVGIAPRITDAEMVALSVMQALLGFTSEVRWLRYARVHLRHLSAYLSPAARLPQAAPPTELHDRLAGRGPGSRHHLVDRRRGGARLTASGVCLILRGGSALRSGRVGEFGYFASHPPYFCGCTCCAGCTPLPVVFALTGAKAYERQDRARDLRRRS